MTTVAVRGTDCVVVCTQKKVPDKLIVKDSVTNIFKINDNIGVIVTGSVTDAKSMITYYRMYAAQFKFKYGYHIPVHVLAKKAAERNQLATQFVGLRSMRCVFTFVGIDEEKGPQVYKVDPSGFCMGYCKSLCRNPPFVVTPHEMCEILEINVFKIIFIV